MKSDWVLGVFDGTHDAGAAILHNAKVIAASNEERYSRQKGAGGWPQQAIEYCLSHMPSDQVPAVAFAGSVNPNPILRLWRTKQKGWRLDEGKFYPTSHSISGQFSEWVQSRSPFPYLETNNRITQGYLPLIRRHLMLEFQHNHGIKISRPEVFDHHLCHASAGHFTSGQKKSLVVVADGVGDGLTTSIWRGDGSQMTAMAKQKFPNSYGLFFATLTAFLGYKPFRHEGKLTGMAALGDPNKIPLKIPVIGQLMSQEFQVNIGTEMRQWLSPLKNYSPEDISAWLQDGVIRHFHALLKWWIKQLSAEHVVLVGGVFANVELNRRLLDTGAQNYYVFPHMGDGGLAVGAAMLQHYKNREWKASEFTSLYLGDDIDNSHALDSINRHNFRIMTRDTPEKYLAEALAKGKIVARCVGRMEYGPRALGNRSILAEATGLDITNELNRRLERSDCMPFAPMMLEDDIEEWVEAPKGTNNCTPWMTINLKAKPCLIKKCPAIVHKDGTLRPQLISQTKNPALHMLVKHYRRLTGVPALINTSLNIHEEPIVRSAEEAIVAAKRAKISVLQVGKYGISL